MGSVDEDLDEIVGAKKEQSDFARVTEILLNDLWKRRKTRLRGRVIPALTTIDVIAQLYDVTFLQEWIDGYTEYVTSENGQGRKEIVDITKFSIDKQTEQNKAMIEMFGRR
jgi:hypothetical protein